MLLVCALGSSTHLRLKYKMVLWYRNTTIHQIFLAQWKTSLNFGEGRLCDQPAAQGKLGEKIFHLYSLFKNRTMQFRNLSKSDALIISIGRNFSNMLLSA